MGLASKKHTATSGDVRAVVNGNYPGDSRKLIRDMASSLVTELSSKLAAGFSTGPTQRAAVELIEQRLESWLVRDDAPAPAATNGRPSVLPVAMLSPVEVAEKKQGLPLTTLYRYDRDGKVYCVIPRGKKNGRMFPAWQFVDPVPSLLPQVIAALRGVMQFELHAFFVTQQDDLNELSPAEVLAGLPFETRHDVLPAQKRILSLTAAERLERVLELAGSAGQGMAD